MEILILSLHLVFAAALIYKLKWFSAFEYSKLILVAVLILKTAAGMIGGYMYLTKYGGSDTYKFFWDGLIINKSLLNNPLDFFKLLSGHLSLFESKYGALEVWMNEDILYNDNRTVSVLHSFIALISFGYYNVHVVWFAFLSLTGLMGVYTLFRHMTGIKGIAPVLVMFFIPSLIWWTSIPSKEAVSIFALGVFTGTLALIIYDKFTLKRSVLLILSLALCFFIKIYVILFLLPALLAWYLSMRTVGYRVILRYVLVYIVLFIGVALMPDFISGKDVLHLIYYKRQNFEAFAAAFPGSFNTYISLPAFEQNWMSLLLATPAGFLVCLMQPFRFSSSNFPLLILSIENLFLIMLLVAGIIKAKKSALHVQLNNLMLCLAFSFSLMALIGLTTPVTGAQIRYKAPTISFLMMIPVILVFGKEPPQICRQTSGY
jgi:hypothetical protein